MPRLIALLAPLLVVGCTPMAWTRTGATPDDLRQDVAFCRQEAWREAQWRSFLYRPFGGTTVVDSRGRHIFVPYTPFGDPFGDRFFEESRLAHFCMRAKGYELVPIDPPS
jgi:hypothetical protein